MSNEKERKARRANAEASRQTILGNAVVAGLIGGVVFAIAQMIGAVSAGMGIGYTWQLFASVLLGAAAFEQITAGVVLVGIGVHFVMAAVFGLIWGFVASGVPKGVRDNLGSHSAAAGIYGLLIWVVAFQLVARGFYPWFLEMNQLIQAITHILFFGVPLGLYLAARLQYKEAIPIEREAPSRA